MSNNTLIYILNGLFVLLIAGLGCMLAYSLYDFTLLLFLDNVFYGIFFVLLMMAWYGVGVRTMWQLLSKVKSI